MQEGRKEKKAKKRVMNNLFLKKYYWKRMTTCYTKLSSLSNFNSLFNY